MHQIQTFDLSINKEKTEPVQWLQGDRLEGILKCTHTDLVFVFTTEQQKQIEQTPDFKH